MNTQRLIEFQDRTVRDLAWAILSPPLIQFQSGPVRGATADWCLGQFEDFAGHLKELDRDPRPLLEFLGDPTRHKLGKYFENLIAYWLEASPNFELPYLRAWCCTTRSPIRSNPAFFASIGM